MNKFFYFLIAVSLSIQSYADIEHQSNQLIEVLESHDLNRMSTFFRNLNLNSPKEVEFLMQKTLEHFKFLYGNQKEYL